MMSYLFRANYTYRGKYLFTASFRRDGSSKFTDANRYADFPSVAVGWNIIEEPFLQDVTFLDNLKLRASWGKTGNEKIERGRYRLPTAARPRRPEAGVGLKPSMISESRSNMDKLTEFGMAGNWTLVPYWRNRP